ncbi:glycosyltransferase family 4 protein [Leptolyngbya ohadii]|uniref:glycosyltransferase family 4 protein n=1 Tax=Leptolyngbya ohadii TaxID=1962290 RepID=UPI000B59F026|nr:glycosyltransferase family 4 protein [Leptolyngbya ohadii]
MKLIDLTRAKLTQASVLYRQYLTSLFPGEPLQSNPETEHNSQVYDLAFILDRGNRGWILDAICREIAANYPGSVTFSYEAYFPRGNIAHYAPVDLPLPRAKAYFFAHYSYFAVCLKRYPYLKDRPTYIWYTHPKGLMTDEAFAATMNQATAMICTCSQFAERMIACGVNPDKVTYVLGAADPNLFRSHVRTGKGAVGFSTAYYERKSPDRILEIVQRLPHRSFILLGRKWKAYDRFAELEALPNFKYVEIDYADYPQYYAQMDVFVSPAKLEGGPIPLVEAMMCNVVPVASKTGFAPDLIVPGENGFLFDIESSADEICNLIEQAFQIKTDVRQTVEHLSWQNFSADIQAVMKRFE